MPKSKMRKLAYIKGFGFEIEGGWTRERRQKYETERIMKSDGSVNVPAPYVQGEINSPVYKDMQMAWEFIKDYYPDVVNESCGLHVHISVKNSDYVRLMEKKFHEEFHKWMEWMLKNHKDRIPKEFKNRKEGKNRYCKDEFMPEKQVIGAGDRYTQLNYCHKQHATMENRMLPGCKDAKTAFFLITQYLLMVENYLKKTPNKITTHTIEIEAPEAKKEKVTKIEENIGEILICA